MHYMHFSDIAFQSLHVSYIASWSLLHLELYFIALHAYCMHGHIAFKPWHFSHIASLILLHLEPYCIACIHGHIAFRPSIWPLSHQ